MAEQSGKTTSWWRSFRWLYAVRCTLACVVTLVAVAVIVRAVVVMLRPEKLQLKLAGGRIAVVYIPSLPLPPPPDHYVKLNFVLRANNPSGRATIDYANVTVRLTDLSSSAAVPAARIAKFNLPYSIEVPQRTMHEVSATAGLEPEEDLPMRYVRALYEGRGVAGAQMELTGILSTRLLVAMGSNPTSVLTTYYCWPVTIAVGEANAADVPCFDKLDAPAHV